MKPPDLKFISKNPPVFRCPACSERFELASYEGDDGPAKMESLVAAYEKHFKKHLGETSNQAALRIVREATEGK
jgi:hypothetical protein